MPSASPLSARQSCPKCASTEVRRVTELCSADAAGLPAAATRPRRQHPLRWAMLALVALGLAALDSVFGEMGRLILGTSSFAGGWIAIRCHTYNSRDLPHLLRRWESSLVCLSCGQAISQ